MTGPLGVGPGDTVALVAPAGPVPPDGLARAHRLMDRWGLRVVRGSSRQGTTFRARPPHLAGTDAQRSAEFNRAWADPEVRAVLCLRGGYGSQRIVDDIAWECGRKLLVGFSDVTALHLGLWTATGLASLHGPGVGVGGAGPSPLAAESLRRAMAAFGTAGTVTATPVEPTFALRSGQGTAEGVLLGGNLAVLATSLLHTRSWAGTVLLLEDVDEPPYRVDRFLTFLGRLGVLGEVSAVVLGRFTGRGYTPDVVRRVLDVLHERLTRFGVPFLGGFPIGHGPDALTVPLGQPAALDFATGTLTLAGGTG
jgi:muramoyltetrapeptide carboxypeptidase